MNEIIKGVEFIKVNNCVNGNPRYIFHPCDFTANPNFKGYGLDRIVTTAKNMGAKKCRIKGLHNYLIITSYSLLDSVDLLLKNLNK